MRERRLDEPLAHAPFVLAQEHAAKLRVRVCLRIVQRPENRLAILNRKSDERLSSLERDDERVRRLVETGVAQQTGEVKHVQPAHRDAGEHDRGGSRHVATVTRAEAHPKRRLGARRAAHASVRSALDLEDCLEQNWPLPDRSRRRHRAVACLIFERSLREDHGATLVRSDAPQRTAAAYQHSDRELTPTRSVLDVAIREAEQDDLRTRHESASGRVVVAALLFWRHPKYKVAISELVDHLPRLAAPPDRRAHRWNRAVRPDNLEVAAWVANHVSLALSHEARVAQGSSLETFEDAGRGQ